MKIIIFGYNKHNNAIAGIICKHKILCKFIIFFDSETIWFIKKPQKNKIEEVRKYLKSYGFSIK